MDVAVVGAGLSGLSTAYGIECEAQRTGKSLQVGVFEARQRLGGVLQTVRQDGFVLEAAANGWLAQRPYITMVMARLGLDSETVAAAQMANRRFIVADSHLHAVPTGLGSLLGSNLLSLSGKLRLVAEPFSASAAGHDESIAAFCKRHFGVEFTEQFVDAAVRGVVAGDLESLSMASVFPNVAALQDGSKSLLLGLARRWIAARDTRQALLGRSGTQGGPKPRAQAGSGLRALRAGMHALPTSLAKALNNPVERGTPVVEIGRHGKHMEVRLQNGRWLQARHVVVATPAHVTSSMFVHSDKTLAGLLGAISYVPLAVVGLGYRSSEVPAQRAGFGFLAPQKASRRLLGAVWESAIFPDRAPAGYTLVRAMVGGANTPKLAHLSERELLVLVRDELRDLMGLRAAPEFVQVIWHERAIAQYTLGHATRLREIARSVRSWPGLSLVGSSYRGAAIEDCVRDGFYAAQQIISRF